MQKRTDSEWQGIITEWERSGQSQDEWCKEKKINLYTFRDRKSKLKKNESTKNPQKQLPVSEENGEAGQSQAVQWLPVERKTSSRPTNGAIRVTIGGFVIVAETEFDETTFSRVCKALKTLC